MDAAALYALAPEDFTAARDAAARQAVAEGDKQAAAALRALRRPSMSAWLVNRLAADHHDLLEELLELGPALAEAQSSHDADELRELGRQRRTLVEAVTDTALQHRTSSPNVRKEVVATLEAALADPASADAVRSGRLVRPLAFAGFGGVDVSGAVADVAGTVARAVRPDRARRPGVMDRDDATARRLATKRQQEVEAAEQAAHEASGLLDDAVGRSWRAQQTAVRARAAADVAERVVTAAASALAAAQADREQAQAASRDAHEQQEQAIEDVSSAQATAEQARAALDALRRGRQVSGG